MSNIKIFYACSPAETDKKFLEALAKQLKPVLAKENVENLYDKDVVAGENREIRLLKNLETAAIIVFLVSPDFLSDPFFGGLLFKKALEQKSHGKAEVIPIIVRSCLWKETELNRFRVLPRKDKAVDEYENQDKVLADIAESIISSVRSIKVKQTTKPGRSQDVPTINVLFAKPIDKNFEYNFNQLFSQLKKFNLKVNKLFLSEDTLQTINECDYLFIFTNIQDGKLFGEDSFLASRLFSLNEIEENLFDEPKVVFIMGDQPIEVEGFNLPLIHAHYNDKSTVRGLLFNTMMKPKVEWIEQNNNILNNDLVNEFVFRKLEKGKFVLIDNETIHGINKAYVNGFTGREALLKELTQKIIEKKYKQDSGVLTIRGANGIGKTSLASKVIIEIAKRGFFVEGIHFLDCLHYKDFKMFEGNIASLFGLDGTIDLRGDLKIRGRFDSLIVLDNFEAMLNIRQEEEGIGVGSEEDKSKIIDLLRFLSGYANVIIISWQVINHDFEEYFEVDQLSLAAAVNLFASQWSGKVQSGEEQMVLEQDILSEILDRNPLAIKIIAKNTPSIKKMAALKEDLRNDDFEGSEQIFRPINYTYKTLSNREQLAFELLSLFPDGVALKEFKECFKGRSSNSKITDKNFKTLENKSMVDVVDGKYQLQPILKRFSKLKFNEKSEDEKAPFYLDVLMYSNHFVSRIEKYVGKNREEIEVNFANNLLESTKGIFELEGKEKAEAAKVLPILGTSISKLTVKSTYSDQIIKFCEKVLNHFEDRDNYWGFTAIKVMTIYFYKSLDLGLEMLKDIISIDEIQTVDPSESYDYLYFIVVAWNIYAIEGYSFEFVEFIWRNKEVCLSHKQCMNYDSEFRRLGALSFMPWRQDYDKYEKDLALGELNIDSLESYLDKLPRTNHLERMQGYYVLAKVKPIDMETINRLVIINEFTEGLKLMIRAFNEPDVDTKTSTFMAAISKFRHVKYSHVETLYYLAKHLITHQDAEGDKWLAEGKSMAEKYHFRYLIHLFNCLKEENMPAYDEKNYPLPGNFNMQAVVNKYNNVVQKRK